MIKVLIIDDSAIVRQTLEDNLNKLPDITVVGTAPDPYVGRDKIVRLQPDIVTLDIEMPRMDGLTFLKKLMTYYPIPVIIVSSITAKDLQSAIKAMDSGAFDVVNKPGGSISVADVVDDIAFKIRQAYKVRDTYVSRRKIVTLGLKPPPLNFNKQTLSDVKTTGSFIAIGSSTGGTLALEYLFTYLPAYLPPVLVVQHMPVNYTYQFANRLDSISRLNVKEAEDGEKAEQGTVYIAKGGIHLTTERRGAALYIRHENSDRVCFQKPSVDVLFNSIADTAGSNVLGILLTGMGNDGADGLLKLRNTGAMTIAQDEESSVVWGMPQAAVKKDAAVSVLGLNDIPQAIIQFAERSKIL